MTALPEVLEKLVPREKVLPDLLLATYHESRGWNDCRQAMLALIRAHGPALLRDAGDAARYRWLRSDSADLAPLFSAGSGGSMEMHSGDELDAAIDAAMHAPGGAD